VLGFDRSRIVLTVEAKARTTGSDSLESLRGSLLRRSDDPTVEVPPNHRRKWEALAGYSEAGPVDVWLVASGSRWSLRAESVGGQIIVTEVDASPSPR
jgi:hypothetical protein